MTNKLNFIIKLLFIVVLFQSCDDDWMFDIPGCMDQNAINYDSNATVNNDSCYFSGEIITINAQDYDEWIYFSFNQGNEVDILDPENSLDWDVAFKRNHIKTNGGLSGSGSVCVIVDTQTWSNDLFNLSEDIPSLSCQTDEMITGNIGIYQGCYNPDNNHEFEDCIKNPAFDNWGYFDDSFTFNVSNYKFFLKQNNGNYVKVWLLGYHNTNNQSGYIQMRYIIIE